MLRKISLWAMSALIAFGSLNFELQESPGDKLLGVWEPSNGRARVKIDRIGNKYYGRIVWLIEPNDPRLALPRPTRTIPMHRLKMFR